MTGIAEIIQSPLFARQKKKLHRQQIKDLDAAVRSILDDPGIGNLKVGDLSGVRIYKFQSMAQRVLLAYEVEGDRLCLCAFGSHENFYRDLKKYLR